MSLTAPDSRTAYVLQLLREGHYCAEIAALAKINSCTVLRIARRHGITPAKGRRKPHQYKRQVYVPKPVSQEPNYRAQAAHLRWGNQLGGRWV
jgi:hypothetical protein